MTICSTIVTAMLTISSTFTFLQILIIQTMKLSVENGVTLELPFTKDILKDEFMSYIARLVMSGSLIILDVEDFDDWMFPEDDGCHCND